MKMLSYLENYDTVRAKKVVGFVTALLLVFSFLHNSYGEPLSDQQGKKVTVTIEIKKWKINWKGADFEFNDYGGIAAGNAQLLYTFNEPGHKYRLESDIYTGDWNYNSKPTGTHTGGFNELPTSKTDRNGKNANADFNKQKKYIHEECHELGNLDVLFLVFNIKGNKIAWTGIWDLIGEEVKGEVGKGVIDKVFGKVVKIVTGVVGKVKDIGKIAEGLLFKNQFLGAATETINLKEFAENGTKTFTAKTEETKYGNSEITYEVSTSTKEIACGQVGSAYMHIPETFALALTSWSEDSISDNEMVLAIEDGIDEGFISLNLDDEEVQTTEPENGITKIPEWIKIVFTFWSNGLISDSDVINLVRYSIEKDIIRSPVIYDLKQNYVRAKSVEIYPETYEKLYNTMENALVAQKSYLAMAHTLLAMRNYEAMTFEDQADVKLEQYKSTNNEDFLKEANQYTSDATNSKNDAQILTGFVSSLEQNIKNLLNLAKENNLDMLSLDKHSDEKIETKLDKIDKVRSLDDYNDAKDKILDDYELAFNAIRNVRTINNVNLGHGSYEFKSRVCQPIDVKIESTIAKKTLSSFYGNYVVCELLKMADQSVKFPTQSITSQPPDLPIPSTPSTQPTPTQTTFSMTANVAVLSDPAGHRQFVGMPSTVQLQVSTADGFIVSGSPPFVFVQGSKSGDNISASGIGTVAGFPNVSVSMTGTFHNGAFDVTYTMGAHGELPTGQPIVFRMTGVSS